MFNGETGFAPGASVSNARTHVRTSVPATSPGHAREPHAAPRFLLTPARLAFGLRYTANLHAVMTSCRKTANNKSERPGYETSCACWYAGAVTTGIRDRGAPSGASFSAMQSRLSLRSASRAICSEKSAIHDHFDIRKLLCAMLRYSLYKKKN